MDRRPSSFDGHNWVFMSAGPIRRLMQCTRCGDQFWEWEVAEMFERPEASRRCDNFNAGRYGYEPVTGR